MDLIEIYEDEFPYFESLNRNNFDIWFTIHWQNYLYSYYTLLRNAPLSICFTVGDDHIYLYDCELEEEPFTNIDPEIGGRLMTLVMIAKFTIENAKFKGTMCIRNPKKAPVITEFVFELKTAEMLQTVGFTICGDSLNHNVCKYEFPSFDMSLTYRCSSGSTVSILDRETDVSRRKLLEKYLVDSFTKGLCQMIQEFEEERLSIKQTVSELVGNCYKSRDILRQHNRISHAAMKNLANRIIDLTNDRIKQLSKKLYLSRIYGLNSEKELKTYKANICTLHTLSFEKKLKYRRELEVIISNEADCTIIIVPIKFLELELHFREVVNDSEDGDDEFTNKQIYTTEEAHFKLSLKKNYEDKAKFELLEFKIMNFVPIGSSHPIEMTMDHLVSHTIEEYISSVMEQTFEDEKLQELAIKPNIYVEDDGDNLYESDEDDYNEDENDETDRNDEEDENDESDRNDEEDENYETDKNDKNDKND